LASFIHTQLDSFFLDPKYIRKTLPPSCAVFMKSGNLNFLEPSGPLQSLRRANNSSRGVLPTVARRCVWSRNLENEEVKARYRTVKIQPRWVVTPRKQQLHIDTPVHYCCSDELHKHRFSSVFAFMLFLSEGRAGAALEPYSTEMPFSPLSTQEVTLPSPMILPSSFLTSLFLSVLGCNHKMNASRRWMISGM